MMVYNKMFLLAFGLSLMVCDIEYSIGQGITGKSNQNHRKETVWKKVDDLCLKEQDKVIAWYRDLHENPELGNREFRTAGIVAEHLRNLGLEVQTGVAHTGVIGILKGRFEGPVIALRADMDALPVKELSGVPYASKVMAEYNGQQVPVMHACGHDAHTAILMGVAEVLVQVKNDLHGTVKFIFQPAEDSKPEGEEGGAWLMIQQGVLENPKPEAIFGLHVTPYPSSTINYRAGGIFAGVDNFDIKVTGRQTHGALPWAGIDAIPVSAQIITALQTVVSRQIDLTQEPAIITIGTIQGGIQRNIIAGEVLMKGTIRTFSPMTQKDIQDRIEKTAKNIAQSAGASAEVSFYEGVPAVINDAKLTGDLSNTINRVGEKSGVFITSPITVGDDFALFAKQIPGMYILLGVAPKGADPAKIINHSPFFMVDEQALIKGVEALSHLSIDYLQENY